MQSSQLCSHMAQYGSSLSVCLSVSSQTILMQHKTSDSLPYGWERKELFEHGGDATCLHLLVIRSEALIFKKRPQIVQLYAVVWIAHFLRVNAQREMA